MRDIDDLVTDLRPSLAQFTERFESLYGYPPGNNAFVGAPGPSLSEPEREVLSGISSDARYFFASYGGLWLPDLWNGVFLGPTAWMARMAGELRAVETSGPPVPVTAVGSDGGGGYLVVDRRDPIRVAHLGVGALRDGSLALQGPAPSPTLGEHVVASSFLDLLSRIVESVDRAASGQNRDPFAQEP